MAVWNPPQKMMPLMKPTISSDSIERLALGVRNHRQDLNNLPDLESDPADHAADVAILRGLEGCMLFLYTVDFDHRVGGQMRMQLLLRVGFAAILLGYGLVRWTIFLFVDRVALQAVALAQQGLNRCGIGSFGRRVAAQHGCH
jgi:hypothetical protein